MTSIPTAAPDDAIVIIGAGHGGAGIAGMLRQFGHTGPLTLLGSEPHHPYHRPPLSKKYEGPEVHQALRAPEYYAENTIDLRLSTEATEIDRDARVVRLADGSDVAYDHLIIATGSTARTLPLPGTHLSGVLSLRTLDDAHVLGAALTAGGPLVIVGGGYVGMEVAAVARKADIDVTIIEREPRALARVASPELSLLLTKYHQERGTEILVSTEISAISGTDTVESVTLNDSRILPAATVLVGIGASPNDEIAARAGIDCNGGILVDEHSRTSDRRVFALGDVARRPVLGAAEPVRLESIPNTTDQARQICSALLGTEAPEPEIPWFWSDQFDLKLKMAGFVGENRTAIIRRGKKDNSFGIYHLTEDNVVCAIESVNAPKDFVAGKKFITQASPVDPNRLADTAIAVRDV